MNHGNNKHQSGKVKPGKIDNFVDHLNKGFGRLLGKKDNSPIPAPNQTNNITFSIVILCASLLLWFCTGFYFLDENDYGLILRNGKVVNVKRGIKAGLTLPYPFGNVVIIDAAPSKMLSISDSPNTSYNVLDKNLQPLFINAKFSYLVTNPKILYQNHLQNQDDFDDEILWQVQSKIRDILAARSITELKSNNFTILSKELVTKLNSSLKSYGIELNKFTIQSIGGTDLNVNPGKHASPAHVDQQPLAIQLRSQAAEYSNSEITKAINESKAFNTLLPAYHQNASQTIARMYNDTLGKIPAIQTESHYNLLYLNLNELKQIEKTGKKQHIDGGRVFTREVIRDRNQAGD
jgi:regulator of protease activity HflC (stomatin/prohibitin superfamily)